MRSEQNTGSRRRRCLKAKFRRELELPRCRGSAVTIRVGQMRRPPPEGRFDYRSAQIHFGARSLFRQPEQDRMIDGMRTDGDERISCEPRKVVPVHTQLSAKSGNVDLIKCREPANDVAHFV